ncbi:MAG: glycosyltransferase family 4 protein [Pseudomonadota bacterium]
MDIAVYTPFKPLDHPNPSGDLIIARGIVRFLRERGQDVRVAARVRARWIYWKVWLWPQVLRDILRALRQFKADPPDIWLTYHTYYKAPDVIGPWVCRILDIPYVIFQGIYSTKPRRRLKSLPGFWLNRLALSRACHVMTNRKEDLLNLKRLLPDHCLTYIPPGIFPRDFTLDPESGRKFRESLNTGDRPVILTAAMFRDDVKSQGLAWLIRCCRILVDAGVDFCLVIAGAGPMEGMLKAIAQKEIPGRCRFAGHIPRKDMAAFYSSGQVFAFPGIRESLGMVFLEAQSCGLPVVAFNNGGIPEVVRDRESGFLVPMYDETEFAHSLVRLITDTGLRERMGRAGATAVRQLHDLDRNYGRLEELLSSLRRSA